MNVFQMFKCLHITAHTRVVSNNFVKMFLSWPTIRFLKAMLIGRKIWPRGYFALYGYSEKKSPPKVFGRFSNYFVELFLGWPSIRFLQAILIYRKIWPPGGGAHMFKVEKNISHVRDPGPSRPSCLYIILIITLQEYDLAHDNVVLEALWRGFRTDIVTI